MNANLRSTSPDSPPRADLAFRVGIVGHRPDRLPKDMKDLDNLRRMLRSTLEAVKAGVQKYADSPEAKLLYTAKPPTLRVASPLAEGADRMLAEEAISLGYQLFCPMPFSQEEYEEDFLPPNSQEDQSRERFRSLLLLARKGAGLTTFELDGERTAAADAYGVAGRLVLNQSDLLIAVWDGGEPAGGGGTVQTLREAVRYQLPVLWIDALAPHAWQLLHTAEDLVCLDGIGRCTPNGKRPTDPEGAGTLLTTSIQDIVFDELGLPQARATPRNQTTTQSSALEYFAERKPWFNFAFMWKLFRDVVGPGRIQSPHFFVQNFQDQNQIQKDWPTTDNVAEHLGSKLAAADADESAYTRSGEDWVNRRLRPHYAWSDRRGDMYADAYRSAYVLIYLLSALAVFMALLPIAAHLEGTAQVVSVAVEFIFLLVIVVLLWAGRKRRWHERWMEYRLMAELIRQIRLLIPLGGGRPFPRAPIHLRVYEHLNHTWMYWQMRAIARAIGVPQAKATPEYVVGCLRAMAHVVEGPDGGQLRFHRDTEKRFNLIAHRLHVTSTALFILTIISIGIHLLIGLSGSSHNFLWPFSSIIESHHLIIERWLVLAAATLPALGAAFTGISNQGEFARLAKRSGAMADAFEQFFVQIEALQSAVSKGANPPKLLHLIPLAGKIAEIMVDEVADWRVVVIEQPVRAA